MKFIFFTDSHFHLFTNYAKPDKDYVNDRFKEQMDALQKVFDIARENQADVIFGGDLFHKRNSVYTTVYNHVARVFNNNKDVNVYLLRGNHDAVSNSLYTYSSIEPLGLLDNVQVLEVPTVTVKDGINLVFLPYGDETEEMKKFIKDSYKEGTTNILVAHIGVEGATTGKGSHRLEGAFGYQDLLPDKYDFILLGHYHKRQYLNGNPNHMYGGCLLQASFSDEGQDKGVHLIDTDKNSSEFIAIDTRKFITLDEKEGFEKAEETMNSGNFIRFIGTPEQIQAVKLDTDINTDNIQVQVKKKFVVEKRIDGEVTDEPLKIASNYAEKYYPTAKEEILECLSEVL